MPSAPRKLKQLVEADLRRAARLIIDVQDEIDPQFRIATSEGDFHIAITLPGDAHERARMMQRVSKFMALKQAPAFTIAVELIEPDCVYCLGVNTREVHACASMIQREPRPWSAENFSNLEWMPRASVAQDMIDLLPRGVRVFTRADLDEIEEWFGANGKFPAVQIDNRNVGAV